MYHDASIRTEFMQSINNFFINLKMDIFLQKINANGKFGHYYQSVSKFTFLLNLGTAYYWSEEREGPIKTNAIMTPAIDRTLSQVWSF